MAKKKKSEPAPEVIEKKPASRKNIQEDPEAVYIYHNGDNLEEIAQKLTGKSYLLFALLNYNGLTAVKDGDVLKWRV